MTKRRALLQRKDHLSFSKENGDFDDADFDDDDEWWCPCALWSKDDEGFARHKRTPRGVVDAQNPNDTSALKSQRVFAFVVVFGGESDDDDEHNDDDGFPELGTTTTTTTTTTKKRDDGQNGGGWWSRRRPEENYASERSENGGVFVPRGESGNESAERSDGDHRNSRYRRRSGVDTAHWSDERVHRAIIYDLYSFTYVPQIPSSLENETVFFAVVVVVSSTRERRLHTIPRFLVRRRNVFSKVVDVCVRIFWWPSPFRVALFRRRPKSKNQKLFGVYPSPLHLCLGSY